MSKQRIRFDCGHEDISISDDKADYEDNDQTYCFECQQRVKIVKVTPEV